MQYRSTAHDDCLAKLLGGLRIVAMLGPLLPPVAHLPLDDPRIDPVATLLQNFLGHLSHQILVPPAEAPVARRTLGQPTPQDLQGRGGREMMRVDPPRRRRLLHQRADDVVPQQEPVQLLHDSAGRLAPQHRAFALMRLQFIDRELFLPPLVIARDQGLGRIELLIQELRQQPMGFARAGAAGILEGILDDPHQDAVAVLLPVVAVAVDLRQVAPQQNLWVCFGSGSRPRLCNRANFATSAVRKPYDFLVTSFTLLFSPSTAPDENSPLARNQFKIRGRCLRSVRAPFFIGSRRDRITRRVHSSRNFPAHAALRYSQNRWKSSRSRYARTVRKLYFSNSASFTVCFSVRFSGRFSRHHRDFFSTGS